MTDIVERLRDYANDDHERLCQGRTYSCSCGYDDKRDPLMTEAADTITALRAEVEQYNRSFDLRWDASMRAIARWQAAHPGNDLNWPDHADLVVWLLERDAALRAEVEQLKDANAQLQEIVNGDTAEEERIRAENEKLRQVLENTQQARVLQGKAITDACNEIDRLWAELTTARAALEEKP